MRTMYDGIDSDAAVIPTTAELVAGYVDGNYVWSAEDWARFPHSVHVRIATRATTNDGHVLDVETGNASPQEAVNWVLTRRHSGVDPTVYCSESIWSTVRAAFATHDVPEPHWWIASYDGHVAIPAGAVAHQYGSFTRWDLSSVADYWPGVDPAPTPPAAIAAHLEEDSVQIEPLSVHPGEYALIVPAGVGELVLAADGYGDPAASLRVVLWSSAGHPNVISLSLGGAHAPHALGHTLPAGTVAVTVRRLDAEDYPIAIGFRP